jgi:uncharacterized integral membrane protein (TIGR00698 family)
LKALTEKSAAPKKVPSSAPAAAAKTAARLDEDWLPVIIGGLMILLVLLGARLSLPSFKWQARPGFATAASKVQPALGRLVAEAETQGQAGLAAAGRKLEAALAAGERSATGAAAAELAEAGKALGDTAAGKSAAGLAKAAGAAAGLRIGKVFSGQNLLSSLYVGLAFMVLAGLGVLLLGGRLLPFLAGFPVVYGLSWLAQFIAGNAGVNYLGLEYVIFALLLGLFISNVLGVPAWLKEAVRTEYYIKTGLVVLGAGILFQEILQAGALGILQALAVVFVVWYACFWVARRLKVDDEFAAMLATAVSICGVSAAIAACGAIKGDKKKLSYVISLVLIVAVPMMVAMPWIARLLGLDQAVAGAWMGGTLDTTGSVVAASALLGEKAMRIGTIVKFSQNVLIGVAAFVLSLWWTVSGKSGNGNGNGKGGERPRARVIWDRFPKFVLGFIAMSLVFSFLLSPGLVQQTKGLLTGLRTVWFSLAFVCIGLETRFTKLVGMGKGKPALAFLAAQGFNVLWTLLLAFLLFGGKLLPLPVLK